MGKEDLMPPSSSKGFSELEQGQVPQAQFQHLWGPEQDYTQRPTKNV